MNKNTRRGWYSIFTFEIENTIYPEELRWSLVEEENIALVILNLKAYRECLLDDKALKNFEDILRFFIQHDKHLILRPVYDNIGLGMDSEPERFSLIEKHLKQLGKVLVKVPNSLWIFQGLLLGDYGEMHHSHYLEKRQIAKLSKTILPYLKKCNQAVLAVRTPSFYRQIVSERNLSRELPPITVFDDAILSDPYHMGTYGNVISEEVKWEDRWSPAKEEEFLQKITVEKPYGGEVIGRFHSHSVKNYLRELESLRPAYLNAHHDLKMLDAWKNYKLTDEDLEGKADSVRWEWVGCSLYDYVGAHLGHWDA